MKRKQRRKIDQTTPAKRSKLSPETNEFKSNLNVDNYKAGYFDVLPNEVKYEIFKYLPLKALAKLALVSKPLQDVVWNYIAHTNYWIERLMIRPCVTVNYTDGRQNLAIVYISKVMPGVIAAPFTEVDDVAIKMKHLDYKCLGHLLRCLTVGNSIGCQMTCIRCISLKVNQYLDKSYVHYAYCFGTCMKIVLGTLNEEKCEIASSYILRTEIKGLQEILNQVPGAENSVTEHKARIFFQCAIGESYSFEEQGLWNSIMLKFSAMEKFKFLYIVHGPAKGDKADWFLKKDDVFTIRSSSSSLSRLGVNFKELCKRLPIVQQISLVRCVQKTPLAASNVALATFLYFCGKAIFMLYAKELMKEGMIYKLYSIVIGMLIASHRYSIPIEKIIDLLRSIVQECCYGTTFLHSLADVLLAHKKDAFPDPRRNEHTMLLYQATKDLMYKLLKEICKS